MGFSNTLKRNVVNEWKDYYVDYDRLRMRIRNRDFKTMLYSEVNKINSFYFLLEKKAVNEKYHLFNEILSDLPSEELIDPKTQDSEFDDEKYSADGLGRSTNDSENDNKAFIDQNSISNYIPLKKGYAKRKKEKFITEFLHSLVKIKAYRDLNSSGLLKLAKKYSSTFQNDIFYEKFNQKLKETYFYKSKRVDSIRNLVKKTYKKTFAKDQPEKAKMVFKRLGKGSKTWDIFYILSGFFTGITFALSFFYENTNERDSKFISGVNSFYFGFFLFGLCLKVFKFYSINYKFIFNFDVVSSMNNSIYLLMVSSLLLISNLIFFFKDSFDFIINPLNIISIMPLVFLFNPFDFFCLNSRIYLVSALSRGLFMPISRIRFRHFYFVDVIQSFKFLIEVIVMFMIPDPNNKLYFKFIFMIFPGIRILQCLKRFMSSKLIFPHIANALKYLLVLIPIILEILTFEESKENPSLVFILDCLKFMSSIASFSWDILIDWVIFRNRYMFPVSFYVFAVIFNFFIRFYWMRKFLFESSNLKQNSLLLSLNGPLVESLAEICRRFVWTLLRVEVEHLNNCDELKFKKSINLTSGEFFYKKDVVEASLMEEDFNNETEFETEMEGTNGKNKETSETDNEKSDHSTDDKSISEDEGSIEHEDGDSSESIRDSTESESNEK